MPHNFILSLSVVGITSTRYIETKFLQLVISIYVVYHVEFCAFKMIVIISVVYVFIK